MHYELTITQYKGNHMIINQQRPTENIRIGRAIKSTVVSTLTTVEETAGTMADAVITVRSGVELIHGALQEPIIEQRIDYALTVQDGLQRLEEAGMTAEQACNFLQVPYTAPVVKSRAKPRTTANISKE